jgi:hypothetical protein
VFLSRNIFANAVNTCGTLKIDLPGKEEDFKTVQTGYQAKSSHDLIKGYIGYIDGILIENKCPSKKEF